jgi:Flp pilus assembly protein CpaB
VVLHRRWLVALTVGLAALGALRTIAPPPAPSTAVVVASHDLPGGRSLDDEDLDVRRVPTDLAPSGATDSTTTLVGRTLAAPVRAGEVLTDRRVLAPGLLEAHPGSVAVPVRIAEAGVRDLLRVGDRVDLVAAAPRAATAGVVADAVPVLALPAVADDGPGSAGALLVVAVPEHDALEVSQVSASGAMSVVLLG